MLFELGFGSESFCTFVLTRVLVVSTVGSVVGCVKLC